MQVAFDGDNDPDDPKNWKKGKKWTTMTIVAMFTLLSPVSSTMIAPALGYIAHDFDIGQDFLAQLTLSVFILAYAVGPLFLGPLSEMYGRAIVLQLANIFYLIFNIACGFSKNKGELIAFRFLSGIGGSVPVVVCREYSADTYALLTNCITGRLRRARRCFPH
jgi:MFS family permease